MSKSTTYNRNLNNIGVLTEKVFGVTKPYDMILKYLATKKNPEKGSNEAEICRYVENVLDPKNSFKREAIHKRLYGTSKIMGLVPSDYLYVKDESRRRGGHQEKT